MDDLSFLFPYLLLSGIHSYATMYEKVVIVLGKLIKGENDLKTLYPELAKRWHPTLNDSTPDCVSAHSNKQFAERRYG